MTSSNFNKIVRSNITLKPWILSKNTSEIVNTYIQKIYKQSQTSFNKHDLQTAKIATPRAENKAPIRSLKSQERIRPPISFTSRAKRVNDPRTSNLLPSKNASGSAHTERLVDTALGNEKKSAVAALAGKKRLLKMSPNYKIYGSRRFGSSASSSNASIFRRREDRRSHHNTTQLNYLLRSFGTTPKSPVSVNSSVGRYTMQARNQHMQNHSGSTHHGSKLSASIQRELMAIDGALKERIALGRKGLKTSVRSPKTNDPLDGWNHPPSPRIFSPGVKDITTTKAELQEQCERLKIVNRMRQFEQLQRMEKRTSVLGNVSRQRGSRLRVQDIFGQVKEQNARKTPHLTARELAIGHKAIKPDPPPAPVNNDASSPLGTPPAMKSAPQPQPDKSPLMTGLSMPALAHSFVNSSSAAAAAAASAMGTASDTLMPKPQAGATALPTATSMMANRAFNIRNNRHSYYNNFW